MTSIYNAQFYGDILVVGLTGCGKTTFPEKIGLNKFFGDVIHISVTRLKLILQKNRMNSIP